MASKKVGMLGCRYLILLGTRCHGLTGGRFEFDQAHAVGELGVIPKVRQAPKDALILADGFSCRTQIEHATDRHALHLAQAMQMALRDGSQGTPGEYPERNWLDLKRNDGYTRELLLGAGLAAGALLYWRSRRTFQ